MPVPLSKIQKAKLAMLAREAFNDYARAARARGETVDTSAKGFAAWRHDQVMTAVHKNGLRCCDQNDFLRVRAHFRDQTGDSGGAFRDYVSAETEPRRQAEAVLVRNLQEFGLPNTYAEAICRRQYHCQVMDASVKQLWSLIYTIRNRGRAKRRKETQ